MKLAAFLLVVVAGVASAASPVAAARDSVHTAGSCTEMVTAVPVDADRAREAVPPGFVVVDDGGQAKLLLFAEECLTSVDGGQEMRSIVAGIAIQLDATTSRGGCQWYALLWTNSRNDTVSRAYQRLGWNMGVVEESSFAVAQVAGAGARGDAAIPHGWAPFELHAVGADNEALPDVDVTRVHCHLGPRGLVRGTFDHRNLRASPLSGTVVFGSGDLWDRLGVRSQTSAMTLFRFSWSGRTEIVPEERAPAATLQGCTDTFVLVDGDEDAIRSAVPGHYTVGGELPVGARLWSISSSCDAIRVGDRPPRPGTVAFMGASIDAPDGQAGPEDINAHLFWAVATMTLTSRGPSANSPSSATASRL